MSESKPRGIKLNPRNLTAKADVWIRGNPISSRPESGVGNTLPGLEIDERGIDKYFFPGLVFEFQWDRADSRPLLAGLPGSVPGLLPRDVRATFLQRIVAMRGGRERRFDSSAMGREGLHAWRAIRDLEPGPVKILLAGVTAGAGDLPSEAEFVQRAPHVERNGPGGPLVWAVVEGTSRTFFDAETGVLDTEAVPPGELQSTMCTPWQYDFRDCKCYYWASNRPDLAEAEDRSGRLVNYLRKDREGTGFPADARRWDSTKLRQWVEDDAMTHVDVIDRWEHLPVVLDDRETSHLAGDVRTQFRRLATVEHALLVEYLHAYYSVNRDADRSFAEAAAHVRAIAIEEMRHFRWVNEILMLLGEDEPEVGRAEEYGETLGNRSFAVSRLTHATLGWFIAVERPSQSLDALGQIDGMYVRLHQTITGNPGAFANAERIGRLIKLIIDEGHDHFERFTRVEALLFGGTPTEAHLHAGAPDTHGIATVATRLADASYGVLLVALHAVMKRDDGESGRALEGTVRCMRSLEALCELLAPLGAAPTWELPEPLPPDATTVEKLRRALAAVERGIPAGLPASSQEALAAALDRNRSALDAL